MIDKNYFINRLDSGESMDDIGKELADMMNKALSEFQEKKKKEEEAAKLAEIAATKRGLVEEMVDIIQELAMLEGIDDDFIKMSDEDIDDMVAGISDLFSTIKGLKSMFAAPTGKAISAPKKTDSQILADFIRTF